ncbi:MAG TPA: glycoside hydrolase family 5 protein [Tepidisphaeraceae bacterium]|jgi:hypothetical protein|nr:glycoside hydrolase family 5 protein [Tepidisphaeraceae bacterium]
MRLAAVFGIFVFFVITSTQGYCADAASILANGDFHDIDPGTHEPTGWPQGPGISFEHEGDVVFLRLHSTAPGKMIMAYRQAMLPAPRPAALQIKLRVRYSDIKPGEKPWFDGRVIFHFKNASGKELKPEPSPAAFHGTSEKWVDREMVVKVPASATILEVMPCLFQAVSGTLDIARCEVFPASADMLPKPPPIIPSTTFVSKVDPKLMPAEAHVVGNRIQTIASDKPVWLQGLCLDSLEWSAGGEHIAESIKVAMEQWKANVIRLPVNEEFWFGRSKWQKDGGIGYRKLVDGAIDAVASHGGYLALDLHRFGAPMPQHVEFWTDAATRYKNNPAVIFELFNEPHDISWKTWRDGGPLKDPASAHKDANAAENDQDEPAGTSVGMQALVDAIRNTGAKNMIIAGGLDWGYDLSGLTQGFALKDRDSGDGIIYSSHIYPWKKDWQNKVLTAAEKYPIFVGEIGAPLKPMPFIPADQQESPYTWAPDAIGLIQKYKLNWTAFSFHPTCAPNIITDWQYTPTPYWGAFVKEALAGKPFEMKKMR